MIAVPANCRIVIVFLRQLGRSSPGPQQPSPVIRKCVNKINMNLAGSVRINKCGLLCLTCLSLLFFYYILFRSSHSFPGRSYVHMNVDGINMRKLLIGAIQVAQLGGLEVVEISKHPDFRWDGLLTLSGPVD